MNFRAFLLVIARIFYECKLAASHEFKSKFKGIINFYLKIRKIANPRQHKNGGKFIPKGIHKEVSQSRARRKPLLKMLFRTSSKGFYAFFDDKDSVVCIKTEPFKARFCGFFATACALQPARSPFYKRLKMTKSAVIASKFCKNLRGNP